MKNTATQIVQANKVKLMQKLMFLFASMFLATQANASVFTKLADNLTRWKGEFYTLLGVIAFCYVMWEVVKVMSKKAEWGDVGKSLLEVGAGGAILVAVEFAWKMFM